MLNKNFKIIFALIILIFSGLLLYFFLSKKEQNFFVVLPHHNLLDAETDKYYAYLKEKYGNFENIVLISPNHFGKENNIGFPEKAKFCYQKNCVNGENLDFLEKSENIFFLSKNEGKTYFLEEHGIGNHFKFLEKYFKNAKVFSLILRINTDFSENNRQILEKLKNHKFSGKTLFVASVDFSHHTNEKAAVFHDLKTYKFLNSGQNYGVEVDCPNCLHLIKKLAYASEKKFFDIKNRTSVDTFVNMNSNFENTSHFYGEFVSFKSLIPNPSPLGVEGSKNYFQKILGKIFNPFIKENSQKIFTFSFFPDFINLEEKNFTKNTKCFYSNQDLGKNPKFWFNRILYSFDLNIGNFEKSEKFDEIQKQELQKVGFEYFGQEIFENENFFLINLKNSEIEKYLQKIREKKSENKKIIVLAKNFEKNLKNILVEEKVDLVFVPHPSPLLKERGQKENQEGEIKKVGNDLKSFQKEKSVINPNLIQGLEKDEKHFKDSEINSEGQEKISETNIFYFKQNQVIFGAIYGENIYFDFMNFEKKDGILDCESFN